MSVEELSLLIGRDGEVMRPCWASTVEQSLLPGLCSCTSVIVWCFNDDLCHFITSESSCYSAHVRKAFWNYCFIIHYNLVIALVLAPRSL